MKYYDYGWRQYDAALGRWNVQDPLTEGFSSYSPYNYVKNSPMNYIDPNGMYPDSWQRPGETAVAYSIRMNSPELYKMMYSDGGGGSGGGFGGTPGSSGGYWKTVTAQGYNYGFYNEELVITLRDQTYETKIWVPYDAQASGDEGTGLVNLEPEYIGGFAPAVGVGNAGQVVKAAQYVVSGAMAVALIKYFQENPVFGPREKWSVGRGSPEPWPIDPQNNFNNKGARALLFEYYLLDLYNTWKDANTPDSITLPSYEGPELSPYDPYKYP